jgi:hypothetical protein
MKILRFGLVVAASLILSAAVEAKDRGGRGGPLRGDYTFRLVPATSFAPFYDGTNGKDSGVVAAPRQDILRVGTLTLDGSTIAGHAIATTDDGLTTVVVDYTFSGTLTMNPDGTGHITIDSVTVADESCTPAQAPGDCATFEGPESYAFVLNQHGEDKTLDLIQTDNDGGGAKIFLTGQAKRR